MADLQRFLARYARQPFAFGRADCLLFLADWIIECRGFDVAEPWRGAYHGWFGAARIIHRAGGMGGLVGEAVAAFGIERTAEPRRGDIAVVRAAEGERGAIVLGAMVARHGDRRIVVQRLPIVAAWSI